MSGYPVIDDEKAGLIQAGQPGPDNSMDNVQSDKKAKIAELIRVLEMYEKPMVVKGSPKEQVMTCCEWFLFLLPNILLCALILPILGGTYTIGPYEAYVMTTFGKVLKVEKEQGFHLYWPYGVGKEMVSLALKTT